MEPALGPPDFVAIARGTGFGANAIVTLAWRPGVDTWSVKADGNGSVTYSVLVIPKDQLGLRELTATAGPATATDDFLVLPPPSVPSGLDVATRLVNRS